MRWPLRNQILIRMILLLIISISLLTGGFIHSRIQASRAEEKAELESVCKAIESFRFPLTQPVLDSIHDLAGVEIAVTDSKGRVQAKSLNCPPITHPIGEPNQQEQTPDGNFHLTTTELLQQFEQTPDKWKVHVFHPRRSFRGIFWEAAWPPFLLVLTIVPIAVALSYAAAANVTQPVARLQQQLENFGQGEFFDIQTHPTRDEIRELSLAFNQMASRLKDHENQVQQNAHLQAMVQFGASTAHHLRNAATGIKMAVQLIASHSNEVATSENYHVAIRQLALMDSHIKKFLMSSKPAAKRPSEPVALAEVLNEVVDLMQPMAEHLNVQLETDYHPGNFEVAMHRDDAIQLMINLISNAIDAASSLATRCSETPQGRVNVQLIGNKKNFSLTVSDNGPGPAPEIQDQLFQPFVTGKPEGTGLGLFVIKEIADRYQARVQWTREQGLTQFTYRQETN